MKFDIHFVSGFIVDVSALNGSSTRSSGQEGDINHVLQIDQSSLLVHSLVEELFLDQLLRCCLKIKLNLNLR